MAKIKKEINITANAKYSQLEKLNLSIQKNHASLKKFQIQLNLAAPLLLQFAQKAISAAHASIEFGSQLKDMAGAAGVGTTELQVLGRVAAQNGSSIEDMGKAILKLTKSTEEAANGNKQLAERFARLGIDINKLKNLAPEKQMERLGIAVHAASDKQAALAEVMALVGQDAGPKLMESLRKLGTEGYDALATKAEKNGEILSGSAIESLDRAAQAFKDLGYRVKIVSAEAVGAVLDIAAAVGKLGTAIGKINQTSAQAAEKKFGLDNWVTSAAYRAQALNQIAAGEHAAAEQSLAAAKVWIEGGLLCLNLRFGNPRQVLLIKESAPIGPDV